MTYEEKLEKVLYKLTEERKLTRKGRKTKVEFDDKSFTKVRIRDICKILLKLQDDEEALTIVEALTPLEKTHPDIFENPQKTDDDYENVDIIIVELDEKFDKWMGKRKKVEQLVKNLFGDGTAKKVKSRSSSNSIYKITYGADQRIIINDLFELSRPNFDSENANVFELLYGNPGKKYTIKEIESEINQELTKSLSKIVENLGFSKDLKKAFFQVSKTSIILHNPVFQKRLDSLDIKVIKL